MTNSIVDDAGTVDNPVPVNQNAPSERNIVELDDYPQIEVDEERGTVRVAGKGIVPGSPEDLPPNAPRMTDEYGQPIPVPEGAKTETEPAPQPAPEVQLNPYEQAFIEQGLDKQFRGGVEEMIHNMPNINRYMTQLEQNNASLRKMLEQRQTQVAPAPVAKQPEPDPEIDPEQFISKPFQVLDNRYVRPDNLTEKLSAVDQKIADLTAKSEQLEIMNFALSKPDFAQLQPVMNELLSSGQYPGLDALPKMTAIKLLYDTAKARQIPKIVSGATQAKAQPPAPDPSRAQTGDKGQNARKSPEPTAQDWINMSLKEMERKIGVT